MKGAAFVLGCLFAGMIGCETSDRPTPVPQPPSMIGNWKFASEKHVSCTLDSDNQDDTCTGLASECGILNFTQTTWLFSKRLPDGSIFTEGGSYAVTANNFSMAGGSSTPNSLIYSLHGTNVSVTSASLTFITTGLTTGCSITFSFVKYPRPFDPND